MKIKALTLYLLLTISYSPAQSIGGYIGGGLINANSPNIGSAAASLFAESPPILKTNVSLRLSFFYLLDIDGVLPGSTNVYFPYLKGLSLKGVTSQELPGSLYLEEAVGFILINDRVFVDVNSTDFGMLISVGAGIDLRNGNPEGLRVGAGTDYAFTFTKTYAKYFSVYLQSQYYF